MRKLVVLLFAFSALMSVAQNKSSVETRALIEKYSKAKSVESMPQRFLDRYPVRYEGLTEKGERRAVIGVLARVSDRFKAEDVEEKGIRITSRVDNIVVMRVDIDKLQKLQWVPSIEYFTVAHRVAPDMNKTRVDTRTDSVQAGLGVPMPFNGDGVLIGITDWGFDYTHPNINKANNMRIIRAWDHFKLSGPAPDGFDYGTEYRTPSEVRAAKSDTSGLYGNGTHGTHVAGICGGNGTNDGNAIGQAPGAKFVMGSWYLDEASWLDQVAWMKGVAESEGKRMVINSSWGMYTFSTLDGTSLLSQAINAYSNQGLVFVTSGGNNGDVNYHLQKTFASDTDTLKSIATWYSSGIGQGLIYWGEPCADCGFEAGFAMVKNSGGQIYYSPMYSTNSDLGYEESYIVAGNDTIHYDIMVERSNALDSRPHVLLNVEKNNGYKLMMLCRGAAGVKVNVFNMANLANNAGNMGCDFVNSGIFGCQNGDNLYGIGEPACAEKTITVAAHTSDYWNGDNYHTGELANFSSYGPTLDGRNKPEISAPGVNVVSSISSYYDNLSSYSATYEAVSGGRRYSWSRMSGTSMSSPAVTGVVALMLQANPNLTADQIREILFTTARNDDKTGPLQTNDSVSIRWGHGKVDALKAVNAAYDRLDIGQAAQIRPELVVFPNPTTETVKVMTGSDEAETLEMFSADGRCVLRMTVSSEADINMGDMSRGVYFVRIQDRAGVRMAKVVKN